MSASNYHGNQGGDTWHEGDTKQNGGQSWLHGQVKVITRKQTHACLGAALLEY